MTVTNTQSGTNVSEVADGIYRVNTPVEIPLMSNQACEVISFRCATRDTSTLRSAPEND